MVDSPPYKKHPNRTTQSSLLSSHFISLYSREFFWSWTSSKDHKFREITKKQEGMSCIRDSTAKSSTECCCTNLFRLVIKMVKIRGVRLLGMASGKSCKLKCKYDPLSYSLNFDVSACGNLSDDEDYYYRFYAFSSRFAATSSTACPRLVGPTSQY
ncbi:hypothetical protein ACET3Z_003521 [Daucus carota]